MREEWQQGRRMHVMLDEYYYRRRRGLSRLDSWWKHCRARAEVRAVVHSSQVQESSESALS